MESGTETRIGYLGPGHVQAKEIAKISLIFFRASFVVEIIGDRITIRGKEIKNSEELRTISLKRKLVWSKAGRHNNIYMYVYILYMNICSR